MQNNAKIDKSNTHMHFDPPSSSSHNCYYYYELFLTLNSHDFVWWKATVLLDWKVMFSFLWYSWNT